MQAAADMPDDRARTGVEFTPVRKTALVKASPELAFRRFTTEMASWWPLRSHSIGGADSITVVMEPMVGGRILETVNDGRECTWGTILAWDPPHRVKFTWHPGRDAATAQDVTVTFTPEGEGTRVELVHSGFERLGSALGRKVRKGYAIGWEYVFGLYAERKGLLMGVMGLLTDVILGVQAMTRRKG